MNPDECQERIRSTDDLDSTHMSTIEFIKNKSNQPFKRNYPVEVKFMKNLAKLNEIEPTPDDVIQTPDVILIVQISNPLISKSKVIKIYFLNSQISFNLVVFFLRNYRVPKNSWFLDKLTCMS